MGEDAVILLELAERGEWDELSAAEKAHFERYATRVRGADIALLLNEGYRRWRRPRVSSSTTMEIVDALSRPSEPPKSGEGNG